MPPSITFFGHTAGFGADFAVMLVVVFLAGVIRGFTGFGSALLAVPALTVLYGPAQAVVIEVLIEIPVSLGLLPIALREAERRTVVPMLAMFVLFVPVGTLLLTVIDPQIVKIVISLFVLAMVGLMSQQARLAGIFSPRATLVAGAISGTSQGLTGMAGPLFATALLARGDTAARTRANIIALACGIICISVLSFWAFGLLTGQALLYAALASPAILLGVWAGAAIFRRMAHRDPRGAILAFLALTAAATLFQALG